MSAREHTGTRPIGGAGTAWYSVDQVGECAMVTAGGLIDEETAPALHDALRVAAEFSPKVVLDLGQVTALDPPGLDVLGHAREQIRNQQGSVVLVAADEPVRTALQRAGLPEAFLVVERAAEAIAALARMRSVP
jgi:anti-anti-sigma factor